MNAAPLVIGLVNNMPDAALAATERQFTSLLQAAAGAREVSVRLFSLPGVPRSDYIRAQMRGRYAGIDALGAAGLDALIVTGTEPRTKNLVEEPYFPDLARLAAWAEGNTFSTIWSCLAAHAAVACLDGIRRTPLAAKLSGVFAFETAGEDPLLTGVEGGLYAPHSRRNGLEACDLEAHGYRVLTQSADAGVNFFTRDEDSLFVFLQGHPEYDADSLLREYARDVGRYLKGESQSPPAAPRGYFSAEVEGSLGHLMDLADRHRGAGLMSRFLEVLSSVSPAHLWRPGAERVYANWLTELAARKALRGAPAQRARFAQA